MNSRFSCFVTGLALLAASTTALAQAAYPTRPIRVIVPYPAGGIVDIVARKVIQRLSHADIPGQPMPLEELAKLMKADFERLMEIVKVSHIAVE
jgi:tripartite-type tricarboxylate transporter receptor subunit TctC